MKVSISDFGPEIARLALRRAHQSLIKKTDHRVHRVSQRNSLRASRAGAASSRSHSWFTLCPPVTSVVKKTDHRGSQRNAFGAPGRSTEQTLANRSILVAKEFPMRRLGFAALMPVLVAVLTLVCSASDVPKNTKMEVRLDESLTSDQARIGEEFTATLNHDVSLGGVVLKKGCIVHGLVAFARSTYNYSQAGELELVLNSVMYEGKNYNLETNRLYFHGTERFIDPRTGREDDRGARKADAIQAGIDAAGLPGGAGSGVGTSAPGTDIEVGPSTRRSGMQVILPVKAKLTFHVTGATVVNRKEKEQN